MALTVSHRDGVSYAHLSCMNVSLIPPPVLAPPPPAAPQGAAAAGHPPAGGPPAGREHRGAHLCRARPGEALHHEGAQQLHTVSGTA